MSQSLPAVGIRLRKLVREMALESKISEWDFGADHAQAQRQDPIMVVIEGQSPTVSFYLPGLGLGAGRSWRVALEQCREMVIMRIVTL